MSVLHDTLPAADADRLAECFSSRSLSFTMVFRNRFIQMPFSGTFWEVEELEMMREKDGAEESGRLPSGTKGGFVHACLTHLS